MRGFISNIGSVISTLKGGAEEASLATDATSAADPVESVEPSGQGAGSSNQAETSRDRPEEEVPDIANASLSVVNPNELQALHVLGRGSCATVYKAEWTRSFASGTSSIVVAVKLLKANACSDVSRQREALALDHPNLVRCFDSTQVPPHLIVSEYCAGGSVFDLLFNSDQKLVPVQLIKIMLDVARGMMYLHRQNMFHRDLKSGNVLLMQPIRSIDQEPWAKVADFGLARSADKQQPYTVGVGTWRYMAPEMFVPPENDECTYNDSVDVYSFGMLLYEELARKIPYIDQYPLRKDADPRICFRVMSGMRPSASDVCPGCPPEVAGLMERCWHGEPAARPTFEEVAATLDEVFQSLHTGSALSALAVPIDDMDFFT